jgi:hypothetical protein
MHCQDFQLMRAYTFGLTYVHRLHTACCSFQPQLFLLAYRSSKGGEEDQSGFQLA